MTVQEAADKLVAILSRPSWLVTIGTGKKDGADCVYVYAKTPLGPKDSAFFDHGWEGFPVIIKVTGEFSLN